MRMNEEKKKQDKIKEAIRLLKEDSHDYFEKKDYEIGDYTFKK